MLHVICKVFVEFESGTLNIDEFDDVIQDADGGVSMY